MRASVPAPIPTSVPLVVDLDGNLIKTDLLLETVTAFIARRPLEFARPLVWLLGGEAHLKDRLAEAVDIDPATLPYNEEVIQWLDAQRAAGRSLILATAAHIRQARKVVDEVLATAAETNSKGKRNATRW